MKLIKRVEISKPPETFNLHIENDHNYIAAGAVVANCHVAKATTLKTTLCGMFAQVPIRWGVTGTVPKAEHESMCLLTSIGPVVGQLRAAELQRKGVLANCRIEICQIRDPQLDLTNFQQEQKFLLSDPARLSFIAGLITGYAHTGNTLVLVDRVETGELLHHLIVGSVFVSGAMKTDVRQVEYDSIETATNKIIIATYGVASVGINIPRLFNLIAVEIGRSFTRVIQSIGRILRKTNDKHHATVYDVCSTLKYSKQHLKARKAFYKEAEYPFHVTKLDYA